MTRINKLKIAILGATGFTGLDLVLFLSKHPKVEIVNLCATKNLGKKISFFDKGLKNYQKYLLWQINWKNIDRFLSPSRGSEDN